MPSEISDQAAHFSNFAPPVAAPTGLRAKVTAVYRQAETELIPALASAARLTSDQRRATAKTAEVLINALRSKPRGSIVEELVQEYSLSTQEGVALMCLAEALLRIPDTATRDVLIRDKISDGEWFGHFGLQQSLFVNAATWGLAITGKLVSPVNEGSLSSSLKAIIGKFGEPIIRRCVDMAMRMMGEQFVMGETIALALDRANEAETEGFGYSYDMLGEAAMTAADAERYLASYEMAIHAIGKASNGRGIVSGPGISIKLSALHPRYQRSQINRVMSELLPRVRGLALLAKQYNIGLNIDAEESDRLELSLDLLESLSLDAALSGWEGLGLVIQAYSKRCLPVIDVVIDLARRAERRIMVRLVKGAYWDAEIKRAQVDGLNGYPVFTRKVYTDVSYLAGAKKLLAAKDFVFPQFATHNAQTLAAIYHMAGPNFAVGDYEFQCLHGMGEALYQQVVGGNKLNRPCRIYAPVGTHETLLAYLVRRLLENGANSSFVNRIANPDVPISDLIADPVEEVLAMPAPGAPHDSIALPKDILGKRQNSAGIDLSNEAALASLAKALTDSAKMQWHAGSALNAKTKPRFVINPGNHDDVVGTVTEAGFDQVAKDIEIAAKAAASWAGTPVADRAACLLRAADTMQEHTPTLMGLVMREAGKSAANAIAEVREAIDFLRYYAKEAMRTLPQATALGPIACISPWNFPLAIFTGQLAAALVAGNSVLVKPAEETPLIAAEAVRMLHAAGIPKDALRLVLGDGRIGAALVAAPQIQGVMFTGSTEVARLIQSKLAERLSADSKPIPLIAETGGQNTMIVDSSALSEQVVADVIASAFDSAGQRCSALRILCLQEDIADRTIEMLKGAMNELVIGQTTLLSTDVGPVISEDAKANIEKHIATMRSRGFAVDQLALGAQASKGTFVAPTLIAINAISDVEREVFGPVLHILRYHRDRYDALIAEINACGYGLTAGLHTRIDETIEQVTSQIAAGNLYINRNVIGAVVGVQPFGGRGLSGTGPKAGGPFYLSRLCNGSKDPIRLRNKAATGPIVGFATWLRNNNAPEESTIALDLGEASPLGHGEDLPGPVGERNQYALHCRGRIYLAPETQQGLHRQIAATLATGNHAVIHASARLTAALSTLPKDVKAHITIVEHATNTGPLAGALIEGDSERVRELAITLSQREGPLITVQSATSAEIASNSQAYSMWRLIEEVSISTNTTAAGGNAGLMALT